MKSRLIHLAMMLFALCATSHAAGETLMAGAQEPTPPPRRPGGFGGPIELGPDDKPAFPDPPAGFDVKREDIPHGRLEMIE